MPAPGQRSFAKLRVPPANHAGGVRLGRVVRPRLHKHAASYARAYRGHQCPLANLITKHGIQSDSISCALVRRCHHRRRLDLWVKPTLVVKYLEQTQVQNYIQNIVQPQGLNPQQVGSWQILGLLQGSHVRGISELGSGFGKLARWHNSLRTPPPRRASTKIGLRKVVCERDLLGSLTNFKSSSFPAVILRIAIGQ